jgi:hypothetical protein
MRAKNNFIESNGSYTDSGFKSLLLSIIFIVGVPLLPLLAEFLTSNYSVSIKSIALAIAILVIGIGSTSTDFFQMVIGLFFGLVDSLVYTRITSNDKIGIAIIYVTAAIMIIWHIIERISRHTIKKQRFFDFGNL